ncbi:MAG: hypothetical protein ACSHW7_07050 [Patiriisocius sp.]|uniref:hypothetical protein n=1 Tax=Patiriisocius sp. TaxID=2822396 RepID=UPI003EF29D90
MKYRILLFVNLLGLLSSCGGDDDTQIEESQAISTTITEITNITDFEAQVNVLMENGTSNTITERGVVYGLENNPTVDDTKIIDTGSQNTFSANITGLSSATQYFVRSYFIVGGDASYSGGSDFITTDSCAQNIFTGDVFLETQDDVEAFGAMEYCKIEGGLKIGNILNNDNLITDISSLSTLTKVKGLIVDNTLLYNLDPLINLKKADFISIYQNANIENIDGLINITSPVTRIRVSFNPNIQNIDGLSNLSASEDIAVSSIEIYQNAVLQNINGLSGIQKWLEGQITITENPLLTNINGLENLIDVSSTTIYIGENIQLENIDRLSSIENSAFSSFYIINNPLLQNINGLSNLSSPLFNLDISGIPNLTNLDALNSIPVIYNLNIINNISLTSIEALSNTEIANENGSLYIWSNDSLLSLNGLENLSTGIVEFSIRANDNLEDFCAVLNTFQDITQPIPTYTVDSNAYNPTQQDIIDGNCSI